MNRTEGSLIALYTPDPADKAGLVRLWTDAHVRRYLGGPVPELRAQEIADAVIADAVIAASGIAGQAEGKRWTIRTKSGGFAGLISLSPHHDGLDTEVSLLLLPEHWGKGLASEALELVESHARDSLNLNRLVAETQTQNLRSCRLFERHGFIRERELTKVQGAPNPLREANLSRHDRERRFRCISLRPSWRVAMRVLPLPSFSLIREGVGAGRS